MQDALLRARDSAIPAAQPIEAAELLDPGQMRQVAAWARTSADMLTKMAAPAGPQSRS